MIVRVAAQGVRNAKIIILVMNVLRDIVSYQIRAIVIKNAQ